MIDSLAFTSCTRHASMAVASTATSSTTNLAHGTTYILQGLKALRRVSYRWYLCFIDSASDCSCLPSYPSMVPRPPPRSTRRSTPQHHLEHTHYTYRGKVLGITKRRSSLIRNQVNNTSLTQWRGREGVRGWLSRSFKGTLTSISGRSSYQ
jgi:hypothetical protein